MKKRRGVGEVVAVIMLMAVIATTSMLALGASSKQTLDSEKTVAGALNDKGAQIQELLSVIQQNVQPTKIRLEVFNYGLKDIVLEAVLVDGKKTTYLLSDSYGQAFANNTIPQRKIMVLEANTVGGSVQLITDTQNLIDIKIL
ncbi:MAG: hypothetical protein AB1608_06975 [Thermoproteota archaeon]